MKRLGAQRVQVIDPVALPDSEIDNLGKLPLPDVSKPLQLISAGRLIHWKGYDYGLRAFAHACKSSEETENNSMDGATYWIVGDGPERPALELLADELGISDRVRFTGMVRRSHVLELLSQCHIFLHPSFHDCGGYATLEAMAAGRPVLCLNLGGPGTQVTHETGFAIDANTPDQIVEDLSRSLQLLARDRSLLRSMGIAGRDRVHECYRWNNIVADLTRRHREVLGLERECVKRLSKDDIERSVSCITLDDFVTENLEAV